MRRRGWVLIGGIVGVWLILLVVIGVVAIGALAGLGAPGEFDERNVLGVGDEKVAMITVTGSIASGRSEDGLFGSTTGSRDVIAQLRQAEEDPDVKAILLRLETPGGGVVASDEIYRALLRVGEEKPIVASMGGIAASGGYYLASAAERIVSNPSTITGSIGVIMTLPNLEEAAENLGIRPIVLTAGDLKDAGSPFRELTEEERDLFQTMLDEAHDQFIEAVAEGRGVPEGEIRALADGRIYTGRQARELGLVDEFGDLEDAYREALEMAGVDEEDGRLVEFRRPRRLEDLFSPFGSSPVEEVKRELGVGFGLKYLYVP